MGSVFLHFRGMALAQSRVPSSGGIHHHLSAALIVHADCVGGLVFMGAFNIKQGRVLC